MFKALQVTFPHLVLSHLSNDNSCTADDTQHLVVNGRSWICAAGDNISDYDVIYIGNEGRTLTNLMLVMNSSKFYSYNPKDNTCREETLDVNRALMKRMYMIEKAKDANIVGIVVGTLAVSNYLHIHNRLKKLIKNAGRLFISYA